MKIDLDALRNLYSSYIDLVTKENRNKCPDPKLLVSCFKRKTSNRKKKSIINHITQCSSCRKEFLFFLEISREENELFKKIRAEMPEKKNQINQAPKKNIFISLWKTKRWAVISSYLALVITIGIGAYSIFITGNKAQFRSDSQNTIILVKPVNKRPVKLPLIFSWRKSDRAEYYIFELFDDSLMSIWRSERIYSNNLALPQNVSINLSPGKNYFWFISGYTSDGSTIESTLQTLRIKK